MAGNRITRFANKKFIDNIDLVLLRCFLDQHELPDGFPSPDKITSAQVFEHLTGTPEIDAELNYDLHRVFELSTETGVAHLRCVSELAKVVLIPEVELDAEAMHLTPRNVAMRAFLDHREVFDRAHDCLAFEELKAPDEFAGIDEDVPISTDVLAWDMFETEVAAYFNGRYKGNYCRLRQHRDENEIVVIVVHGKMPVTTTAVENQQEKPITFRETTQSILAFDAGTGRLKVGAHGHESLTVAKLFAKHLLKRPDFFDHADSRNLYTLKPIKVSGNAFKFDGDWDDEFVRCHVAEIQVSDSKRGGWRVTVRDPVDALQRLCNGDEDLDLAHVEINHIKLQMEFNSAGRKRKKTVKIKPPSVVSFDRKDLEDNVMEHLKRNGFCIPRDHAPVSVAAAQPAIAMASVRS
jgi:hypothetical protein